MNLMPGMNSAVWLAAHTENALNAVVCPDCGGHHQVNICPSNRKTSPEEGAHFSIIVGAGACEGFRRKVRVLAMMHISAPNRFELHFQ